MKLFKYYLGLFILTTGIYSCGDDEVITQPDPMTEEQNFDDGVFMVNEGAFNGGSGTVDYYDRSRDTLLRNVYSSLNDGAVLGSILQSMNVIGDNAYFVLNNSQKIEVANANTMFYKNTITGLSQPRYVIESSQDLIVSQWGDGTNGNLLRIDTSTNLITNSFSINGPEQMTILNNKLYVANSGGFGIDSTVTIHDVNTFEMLSKIEVGKKPTDMVVDNVGDVWVLCSGSTWPTTIPGSLNRISNESVISTIALEAGGSNLIMNDAGDRIYFIESNKVWTMSIDESLPSLFYDYNGLMSLYSLGYDSSENLIYVGEADFSGESKVSVWTEDSILNNEMTVGVAVGSFLIR